MEFESTIKFIRELYNTKDVIPLHVPSFTEIEKEYICEAIESTYVSSVGKYVDRFEMELKSYTGAKSVVATSSGTSALHSSLYALGVKPGDFVITQSLTFVATCNVLYHMCVDPIFIDVSRTSMGLCPEALGEWLDEHAMISEIGECLHKKSERKISAIVPMHTFGHPVDMDALLLIASKWKIPLVEDAAESLGSYYKGKHTGTLGRFGVLSFNGNKIITTGGGGAILCNESGDGKKVKHLTSTAKVSHPYEFFHDEAGFNYRMPNLNAALGCGQMKSLMHYIEKKRELASQYQSFFKHTQFEFMEEPEYAKSNYWLNTIKCPSKDVRDSFLELTNRKGVLTRPVWALMSKLPMYSEALRGSLKVSEDLEATLVNIPSSPILLSVPNYD